MNPATLIFLGPSGCGKGTQAALVKAYLERESPETPVISIDVGGLFRSFWKESGYTYDLSHAINVRGDLQPTFLQVYQWANYLVEHMQGGEHIIIDGTPRRIVDAKIIDSAFNFFQRGKPYLIFLNLPRAQARERVIQRASEKAGGRAEDLDTALIDSRLDWYEKYVIPSINFFRDNPRYHFVEINADQSIEKVHEDIMMALTKDN